MKIFENLQKAHAAVVVDTLKGGDLGVRLGALAIKAITGGIKSDEWKIYMSVFADNAAQLNRLAVVTPGEPSYLPQARAYIVSNSVCDFHTDTKTQNRVTEDIDKLPDLDPTPDTQFIEDNKKIHNIDINL